MKVLVTGSKGFLGSNLVAELESREGIEVLPYDVDTDKSLLKTYTEDCDMVFHLAGVNRPKEESEFMEGNFGFTTELLELLKNNKNKAPIVLSSSTQAELNNEYGKSKRAAEDYLFEYGRENQVEVYVYRLTNLFGKWSRPNYNSVVSTFCHNIAHDLEININDPKVELELCYIDDVLEEFARVVDGNATRKDAFCEVPVVHKIELGELARIINSFKERRESLRVPQMNKELNRKLYSTFLSYLPEDRFSYPLTMHEDHRGSFTEFIRTSAKGQFSVNISKPGITKGEHWHHSKNEKFLVVSGEGVIRLRRCNSDKVIEHRVSGEKLEVVDIPPGYTHNISNTGESDMVTIMWANECFDPERPDTYYLEV